MRYPFRRFRLQNAIASAALAVSLAVAGADETTPGAKEVMDYGPVIAESIQAEWPEGNTAMKGLAVRLDEGAGMVFDTDLLRWAAATEGGWIDIGPTSLPRYKDQGLAQTEGEEIFATAPLPGWAKGGSFEDPRDAQRGNLPKSWAHYKGYYRHGERVLLHYTVGNDEVWELPGAVRVDGRLFFSRAIEMTAQGSPHDIYICALPDEVTAELHDDATVALHGKNGALLVGLSGASGGRLRIERDRLVASLLDLCRNLRRRPRRTPRFHGPGAARARGGRR